MEYVEWEYLIPKHIPDNRSTTKMKVDGGWIYVIRDNAGAGHTTSAAVFVPDIPKPI